MVSTRRQVRAKQATTPKKNTTPTPQLSSVAKAKQAIPKKNTPISTPQPLSAAKARNLVTAAKPLKSPDFILYQQRRHLLCLLETMAAYQVTPAPHLPGLVFHFTCRSN
jgi:hypothetical protein